MNDIEPKPDFSPESVGYRDETVLAIIRAERLGRLRDALVLLATRAGVIGGVLFSEAERRKLAAVIIDEIKDVSDDARGIGK